MSLTTDENGAVTLSKTRHEFCIQVVYEIEALAFVLANVGMSDTNPALGRTMHEAANEIFGGAFGAYQAPTDLQRMGVR